jgi:hypothetical protein
MNRLALFLAGIVLGLFVGRYYHLIRVHDDPDSGKVTSFHLRDNDESWYPCEYLTRVYP